MWSEIYFPFNQIWLHVLIILSAWFWNSFPQFELTPCFLLFKTFKLRNRMMSPAGNIRSMYLIRWTLFLQCKKPQLFEKIHTNINLEICYFTLKDILIPDFCMETLTFLMHLCFSCPWYCLLVEWLPLHTRTAFSPHVLEKQRFMSRPESFEKIDVNVIGTDKGPGSVEPSTESGNCRKLIA